MATTSTSTWATRSGRRSGSRPPSGRSSPIRPCGFDVRRACSACPCPSGVAAWITERIDDSAYLERLGQLRTDLATMDKTPRGELAAKRAVEWLRVLAD